MLLPVAESSEYKAMRTSAAYHKQASDCGRFVLKKSNMFCRQKDIFCADGRTGPTANRRPQAASSYPRRSRSWAYSGRKQFEDTVEHGDCPEFFVFGLGTMERRELSHDSPIRMGARPSIFEWSADS
jgi:hypothetical protein